MSGRESGKDFVITTPVYTPAFNKSGEVGVLVVQAIEFTAPVYTPAFNKSGEVGVLVVQAIEFTGSFPVLGVSIEHKNYSESAWSVLSSFSSLSVPGQVRTKKVEDAKEQLRLKLTLAAGLTARVFIHDPAWRG